MAESVFAMRLVNLRSVTCYTDQNFKENAHFEDLNRMLLKRGTGSGERGTGNGSKITSSQRYPP